ncbi:unnamed protein product [Enterobius vermicularis]|uniref:MARVEL domain-containing protein n=1 Tax=Enterobius vermicularis TaxID=51028 RepID=A0A0N4VPY6_ENTVE|nr:unnamed protein product [Enterobius vermicularis]
MAIPHQLVTYSAIKILIIRLLNLQILTIIVLVLLDPTYTTAYISINYEIVLIYIFSSLTFLYCIVSIIMYAIMQRKTDDNGPASMTNCALTEVILAGGGMIAWMVICGICGTVSQRTIIDTGEKFGWMSACAGINVALFLAILALSCLNVLNDKILSPDRSYKYGSQYRYGSRI